MTNEQFDLLLSFTSARAPALIAAARLVLVAGEQQANAVLQTQCEQQHLSRLLKKMKLTHEKLRQADQTGLVRTDFVVNMGTPGRKK
ncbi:hypothetical protein [Alcaligenes sp. SDU_A2]|uniref:hypothetical protein n=1 Tax=Alcaligenes sp. SDU_A2 TaxID=3136634 RepID=UPI00311F9D02